MQEYKFINKKWILDQINKKNISLKAIFITDNLLKKVIKEVLYLEKIEINIKEIDFSFYKKITADNNTQTLFHFFYKEKDLFSFSSQNIQNDILIICENN